MINEEFEEGKELVAIKSTQISCETLIEYSKQEHVDCEKVKEFIKFLKDCENKIWENRRGRNNAN